MLASCSTTTKNSIISSNKSKELSIQRDLQDIYSYKNFFEGDLEILQQMIDNQEFTETELRDIKLIKKKLQKNSC